MEAYVIQGGAEGKARLNVLAQILEPVTRGLLERIGVPSGGACLDVGCGGGDVTLLLARMVGPTGCVVGVDRDPRILELAHADADHARMHHVAYHAADAASDHGTDRFDLAHARFLLSHVSDPRAVLASMWRALRPGGCLVVVDIDFSGYVCYPECVEFDRYLALYRAVVQRRGGDADLGPRLPGMVADLGAVEIEVNLVQPIARTGPIKEMARLTMERIADAVRAEKLADEQEIVAILAGLRSAEEDPRVVQSLPRIFQVQARRAE